MELQSLCAYCKQRKTDYYYLIAYEALKRLNAPVSRILNGTRRETTKRILNDMLQRLTQLQPQVTYCELLSRDVKALSAALLAAFPEDDSIQLELFDTKPYEVELSPKKRRWK
jgi:ferritin-like protein